MKNEIHEFGSCPLRPQRDYGEKTASASAVFNDTIDDILHLMESFKYGCRYIDGLFTVNMALIDEKDGYDIYIQSPLEFWNSRAGMCHDASVFVDAMLRKESVDHKCYYLKSYSPPHYSTHSFIVAQCHDGFYRIIDVFSAPLCYYEQQFDSYEKAFKWRYQQWINSGEEAVMYCGIKMPSPKCCFVEFEKKILGSFSRINCK